MSSLPTQVVRCWPTPDSGFLVLVDPYTDQAGNPVLAVATGATGNLLVTAPNGVALLTAGSAPVDMRIEVFDHDPGPEDGWDDVEVADFRFRGPDVRLDTGTSGPRAAVILSPPGSCVVRAHRKRSPSGEAWPLQLWARVTGADESVLGVLARAPRPTSQEEARERLAFLGQTPLTPT